MKKAELQMQESILVIFIVTIIIGISLLTFYQLQVRSISNYKIELEQNRDLILLSTLVNKPELSYSYLGNEENALDTIKLLDNNLANLGFKEIIVKQVYPPQLSQNNIQCTKNNYPNCDFYIIYSRKPNKITNTRIISLPISLYFPYSNDYKAGVVELRAYS